MRFLSLFSGIEAASAAWEPLGWKAAAFAEIEPFPSAVLAERWPGVPNLGDVTKITGEQIAALGKIDLVVGGSPCQDLSIAGKRAGLSGERSGLFHELVRIFHAARSFCGARFLLWENVPGAFGSHRGRDFALVAGTLAGCRIDVPENGWGTEGVALGEHGLLEWAVLDAQWFGVAQRRRRVFALLDSGDWRNRPPILLEPDCLRGDSPPRETAREDAAGTAEDGAGGVRGDLSYCFDARGNGDGRTVATISGDHESRITDDTTCVVWPFMRMRRGRDKTHSVPETALTLTRNYWRQIDRTASNVIVHPQDVARRLTPLECERLMGFPDGYTRIEWRGKPAADTPRYKALGNSMAVPVMRWIGQKINAATANQTDERKAA